MTLLRTVATGPSLIAVACIQLSLSAGCTEMKSSLDRGPEVESPPASPGAPLNPLAGAAVRPSEDGPTPMGAPGTRGEALTPGLAMPPLVVPPEAVAASDGAGLAPPDAGGVRVTLPDAAVPEDECLDGSVAAGRCYRAIDQTLGWLEAREECLLWGGDLVSIESSEEDAFVASLVDGSVWLGANDLAMDGLYAWADGRPLGFEHWGDSQPDNPDGQDCVEMRQGQEEEWFDIRCDDLNGAVCERALGE